MNCHPEKMRNESSRYAVVQHRRKSCVVVERNRRPGRASASAWFGAFIFHSDTGTCTTKYCHVLLLPNLVPERER
jgi:hypothetical protein